MGAFKLGKMTLGSLFKKPETVLYPLEKKPQPAGLKGHIVVDVAACILCGMCERNCTTSCITVDKGERFWAINPYSCIQCGYCITVCPKKCLHMDPNYWAAAPEKSTQRFTVPTQGTTKAAPTAKPAQAAEAETKSTPAQTDAAAPTPPHAESAAKATPAAPVDQAPAAKADAPASAETPTPAPETHDAQLENLIAHLDPEKAKIVESALAGR